MGNKRSLYPMESVQKRSGLEGTEFWRGGAAFLLEEGEDKIVRFVRDDETLFKTRSSEPDSNRKKYSNKIGTIFSRQYFILYYFYIIFDLFFSILFYKSYNENNKSINKKLHFIF